jgi:hypothetical protein
MVGQLSVLKILATTTTAAISSIGDTIITLGNIHY